MRRHRYLYAPLALVAAPLPCIAGAAEDHAIIVTASGVEEPLSQTGQTVTTIGRDTIESVQGPDPARLLERFPGVAVTRSGGPGALTGLSVRGADPDQLLVVVDGVRVEDIASPGGGFDFGNLLSGSLRRIELLRGSNSTIWGARAIGGVLAAETRQVNGVAASAEYGAHDTLYVVADAGTGTENHAGLGATYLTTSGFSAAQAGTEPDGYRQQAFRARSRFGLAGPLSVVTRARIATSRLELDGFPPPDFTLSDTEEVQNTHDLATLVGLRWQQPGLSLAFNHALYRIERDNYADSNGSVLTFASTGRAQRFELQGETRLAPSWRLRFGGEREWQRYRTAPQPAEGATRIDSLHAQLDLARGPVALAGGLRVDDHRQFGTALSLGADASVRLDDWRLRASYGEGFRPPTLFQLLSEYGNPALAPERSRSLDLGLEWQAPGRLKLEAIAFRRDSRDLIGFVSCFGGAAAICAGHPFGTYDNVGRARAQGIELVADWRPDELVRLQGHYTRLAATDRTPGPTTLDLPRRPRRAATLAADWRLTQAITVGADLRLVSASFEDPANTLRLDPYQVLTLRSSWAVFETFTLFGRIENLWNERYQTALGYATQRRAVFIGLRTRP